MHLFRFHQFFKESFALIVEYIYVAFSYENIKQFSQTMLAE